MAKSAWLLCCFAAIPVIQGCSSSSLDEPRLQRDTWIIAHRGASAYAPENTIAAIEEALRLNSHAIEIDFRQTKDCALVAFHDASLNRTTNGRGAIADITLAQAKQLDAGSWFDQKFAGEPIPTIEEVAKVVGKKAKLILELKEAIDGCPSPAEQAVKVARDNGIESSVYIKSFYYTLLEEARVLAPDIKQIYVYLFYSPTFNWMIDHRPRFRDPLTTDAEVLQEHRYSLSADFVKAAQQAGKQVVVWDVQNKDAMIEAINIGVDAIETDFPDVALELLN